MDGTNTKDSPRLVVVAEKRPARIYSEDEKREAVALMFTLGTQEAVAKALDIPQRTVSDWTRTEWWAEYHAQMVRAVKDESGAAFRRIVRKSSVALEDRLDHGDLILDRKGREVRKPISAKDLTVIMAIATDKDRVLRGEPTTISGKATSLKDKAAEFAAIAEESKPKTA